MARLTAEPYRGDGCQRGNISGCDSPAERIVSTYEAGAGPKRTWKVFNARVPSKDVVCTPWTVVISTWLDGLDFMRLLCLDNVTFEA